MTTDEKIAEIRRLAERLVRLTDDPQPGLATWTICVGQNLNELAAFAPSPPISPAPGEKR